jgi:hypothetical protein
MDYILEYLRHDITNIVLFFSILFAIDKLFLTKARWFILHFIANAIVCYATFNDVISIVTDPLNNQFREHTAGNVIMALHLYHMLMFKNIQFIDWVHHIVMMTILICTYSYQEGIYVANYNMFFLSGLPGGIDYLLLTLVKYDVISKLREKYINSKLNVWIRGPGIIVGAYLLFLQWIKGLISAPVYILVFILAGLLWNAQFFTERIISNYYHKLLAKEHNRE